MKRAFASYQVLILVVTLMFSYNSGLSASVKTNKSGSKNNPAERIILTVGPEKITFADLEKAFKKNMNRKDMNFFDISRDSLNEFIDLFVKYRLKVLDAIGRGFDKDSGVLSDIQQNRKILAESFYYDKKLVEPKVQEMLKLRDRELQFAFILFKFPPLLTSDTINTYTKGKACLDLLKKGADFSQLAKDSSEDKETASRGGLIADFVTSGKIQRPIESALYSLKPGQVYPELVRFRDGYLILKLVRSVPRIKVKASHILLTEGLDKDTAKVVKKADSLIALLKKGVSFSRLAEENSDDPSTAVKGGQLGSWYSRSSGIEGSGKRFMPEFEETMFNLKNGEISGKVFTEYGIHIIRRDSSSDFDKVSEYDDIKKLYKRIYFDIDKRNHLDSLEKLYGFSLNSQTLNTFLSFLDTNKSNLDTAWASKIPDETKGRELFKFNNSMTTVAEFIKTLNEKSEFRGTATNHDGIKKAINKIIDPLAFDLAAKNLEQEYPEFAALIKEFSDGILLFKVEALEVWDRLKFDSTAAKSFWDTTRMKYKTLPAYDITEIFVLSDSLAKEIYAKAKNENFLMKSNENEKKREAFESLAEQFTQRAGFREKKGNLGIISSKDNELAKKLFEMNAKEGDIFSPMPVENGYSIYKVNKVETPRVKTFEEAIPDFAPEFQELSQKNLIEKWLSNVQSKNPVQINKSEIDKVISDLKKTNKKK